MDKENMKIELLNIQVDRVNKEEGVATRMGRSILKGLGATEIFIKQRKFQKELERRFNSKKDIAKLQLDTENNGRFQKIDQQISEKIYKKYQN